MNVFEFDTYFNNGFEIEDFFEIVDSFESANEQKQAKLAKKQKQKEEKITLKKVKKTYAAQITELKQEIMELRQEMELRDAQILSLIKQPTHK